MKRQYFRRWLAMGLHMMAELVENPPRCIITPPDCSREDLEYLRGVLAEQDWGIPASPVPTPARITRRRWWLP